MVVVMHSEYSGDWNKGKHLKYCHGGSRRCLRQSPKLAWLLQFGCVHDETAIQGLKDNTMTCVEQDTETSDTADLYEEIMSTKTLFEGDAQASNHINLSDKQTRK